MKALNFCMLWSNPSFFPRTILISHSSVPKEDESKVTHFTFQSEMMEYRVKSVVCHVKGILYNEATVSFDYHLAFAVKPSSTSCFSTSIGHGEATGGCAEVGGRLLCGSQGQGSSQSLHWVLEGFPFHYR